MSGRPAGNSSRAIGETQINRKRLGPVLDAGSEPRGGEGFYVAGRHAPDQKSRSRTPNCSPVIEKICLEASSPLAKGDLAVLKMRLL